jgi:AcrR family transcriptional regulator
VRRDAARNQELILRTAHDVFAEQGTEAGLDAVAARAGIGVGTVYRHFPTKDVLLDRLVNDMFDRLVEAAEKALAQDDGTGMETFLRELSRSLIEHRGYSTRFVSGLRPDLGDQLGTLVDRLLSQAKAHGAISDHTTKADLQILIWGISGVVSVSGPVAPDAWKRFLDIHLAGLRGSPFPSARPSLTTGQIDGIVARRPTAPGPAG